MLVSTVLNLFFIPALYVILQTLLSRFSRKKHPKTTQEAISA
jgi:hydrophobic/amphiphilic exporter-1 (mainly G- bacteria), HAE1 family